MASDAEVLQQLVALLELAQTDTTGDMQSFRGSSTSMPHGRVFGGQVLGQTVMAAGATVDPSRDIHSMHAYFLRAGDPTEPIDFSVEQLRDGSSFSARRVQALQHGQPILSMIASFQLSQDGPSHQAPMPEVPAPELLPTTADLLGHLDHPVAKYWATQRPIDIRYVNQPIFLRPDPERKPAQCVWMRTKAPLPADASPLLHRAILAFASDYTLLEPALRTHGLSWIEQRAKLASLDHAMWWHAPFRADEWLLYVLDSAFSGGSRALGQGRFYRQDGTLVASVAQEGLIRIS